MTKKEREFSNLGWWLIERKLQYYKPELVHPGWQGRFVVADDDYDAAEQRYLTLCRELGHPNTIVHKKYPGFEDLDYSRAMMEVDMTRPSVQLVVDKLSTAP